MIAMPESIGMNSDAESNQTGSTGLLIIDPYNDFVSFPGKSWLLTRQTPGFGDRVANMRRLLEECRDRMGVFYAPHARHRGDTYDDREFPNPSVCQADFFRAFRADGWGGRFRPELAPHEGDFVASEHMTSSGFVGTDLEQLLHGQGVERIAVCGCLSNTCVESTVRSAIDLGFHVTVLVDAIVAMSAKDHRAGLSSFRQICHATMTTAEFLG